MRCSSQRSAGRQKKEQNEKGWTFNWDDMLLEVDIVHTIWHSFGFFVSRMPPPLGEFYMVRHSPQCHCLTRWLPTIISASLKLIELTASCRCPISSVPCNFDGAARHRIIWRKFEKIWQTIEFGLETRHLIDKPKCERRTIQERKSDWRNRVEPNDRTERVHGVHFWYDSA